MTSTPKKSIPASCLVYTPAALAEGMVKSLKIEASESVLEPCVGQGALLRALAAAGTRKSRITGLDLELKASPLDKAAQVKRGVDFLRWSRTTKQRFNKIVANPPYIAIERLPQRIRSAACNVNPFAGLEVKASSNTWYAFLVASLGLLKRNGSLCFVLPASWDFANYAEPLRSQIGKFFERVEVHRCRTPLFEANGIQDGSVVLIARQLKNSLRPTSNNIRGSVSRFEYEKSSDLIKGIGLLRRRQVLKNDDADRAIRSCFIAKTADMVRLEDALTINIGGVTGDASFFLMDEETRKRLSLPTASLRPVISRARHLVSSSIDLDVWQRLRAAGERVWLF